MINLCYQIIGRIIVWYGWKKILLLQDFNVISAKYGIQALCRVLLSRPDSRFRRNDENR